jgi:hypothetical protein
LKDHSSIPNRFVPSLSLYGEKSKAREIAGVSVSHGSVRRWRETCRTENKFLAASFNIIFYWTNLIPKETGSRIQVEEISNV